MVMARLLLLTTLLAVMVSKSMVSCHEASGLTFEVEDNDRFCFHEQFNNASVYIIDYKVSCVYSKPTIDGITLAVYS